jgi:hypothetical protein
VADFALFERARDLRAAIKAHEEHLADENYNTMRENRLQDFQKSITSFATAMEAVRKAEGRGVAVHLEASLPRVVEVDDPTEFITGNGLTQLEATIDAAVDSIDESLDRAFDAAIAELDAHPAGEHELRVLADLDLETAESALNALTNASERWWKEIDKPTRPDVEVARNLARELDNAWTALADSGITQEQVDLLRRLSGDCVPLTTVNIRDITWLFEIGFASTLKLCSNSSRP